MPCLPMNQFIKSVFGNGQKPDKSLEEEEKPAAPLEISSPRDFRKETVSLPGLSADEIAHLREQAIAATLRNRPQTPPPRDSYSSRGHGRNGSYASTLNSSHPSNFRNGSVSSHPPMMGHGRNGSVAGSQHSYWGNGGSPQRMRYNSVY